MQKRIVERLSQIGWACAIIRWVNLVSTALIFISFPAMLIIFAVKRLFIQALILALSCAVPFLIVTGVRALLDRPRPFEAEGYTPLLKREKGGRSFPSRHALSASVISTLWLLAVGMPVGIILWVFTLALSVCRYLSGVHYLSDLLVGIAVGTLSGILGVFILP